MGNSEHGKRMGILNSGNQNINITSGIVSTIFKDN